MRRAREVPQPRVYPPWRGVTLCPDRCAHVVLQEPSAIMVRGEVRWLVNRIPEMAHTLLRGSWRLRHPAIHGNFLHARYCDRHPQILKHALSASVRSEQEDLSMTWSTVMVQCRCPRRRLRMRRSDARCVRQRYRHGSVSRPHRDRVSRGNARSRSVIRVEKTGVMSSRVCS